MQTTLYLVRHGATEANLARPPLLQGRYRDRPLARQGILQAEATRAVLEDCPIDLCYTSPLMRAMQTAHILAAPHGLIPQPLAALTECDVGRWEGLDWQTIRERDAEACQRFLADPARHGYPGGESYQDVWKRASAALEKLFTAHLGQSILAVAHHVVNRTYLAGLMGLPPSQARQVVLDNCAVSIAVRRGKETRVHTLADTAHLRGLMHDKPSALKP